MSERLRHYMFYALGFENTFTFGTLPVNFSIFTRAVWDILPCASFDVPLSIVRTFTSPWTHIDPISPGFCGSYHAPSATQTTSFLTSSVTTAPHKILPCFDETTTRSPFSIPFCLAFSGFIRTGSRYFAKGYKLVASQKPFA